ncbi:aminotransferase class III-fold pyridoxal phosphate-dependent enzyme [Escherichia coli]
MWDVEGREYLDFAGGIAVLNTGHLHPKVVAAVEAQLKTVAHLLPGAGLRAVSGAVRDYESEGAGDFARKRCWLRPVPKRWNAVKIARAATKRSGTIAFSGAYHGRTHYTLALTGKVNPYSAGMGLMPGHVYRALYPCPLHGISEDDAIASIHRIFKNDAAPEDIAAIVIEPVQGEGGFYASSPAFMQRLRALCDEHGIMLIADEVQSGAGVPARCLRWSRWALRRILPPLRNRSRRLPAGGRHRARGVMDAVAPGGLGGTYAGNPIACVAALEVLKVFEQEICCKVNDWAEVERRIAGDSRKTPGDRRRTRAGGV